MIKKIIYVIYLKITCRLTMSFVSSECAAQSIGPANQLFGLLIQTIITAQCAISSPDQWPKDYAQQALESGNK